MSEPSPHSPGLLGLRGLCCGHSSTGHHGHLWITSVIHGTLEPSAYHHLWLLPCLTLFSCSVVSNPLQPHEWQHARLLSSTVSWILSTVLLKLMSTESVMPSNHLIYHRLVTVLTYKTHRPDCLSYPDSISCMLTHVCGI